MAETQRIELTEEQFAKGELVFPANHVIVEMTHNNDYAKSKGGIIVGLADRATYAEGKNSLGADMQEVWGTVVKLPPKLNFDKEDPNSMDWETDMELEIGDLVWFGIIESANCSEIVVGERLYKIIPYEDLYVAKRDIKIERNKNDIIIGWNIVSQIIPLNGFVLCQTLNRRKISDLDVISEGHIDTTRCIVRFVGKPNKQYKVESYVDFEDLQPGDEVLLAPRTPFLYLERKKYLSSFDGDNLYIVIPRRKISMLLKRDKDGRKDI